jgi:hypothetical protein
MTIRLESRGILVMIFILDAAFVLWLSPRKYLDRVDCKSGDAPELQQLGQPVINPNARESEFIIDPTKHSSSIFLGHIMKRARSL